MYGGYVRSKQSYQETAAYLAKMEKLQPMMLWPQEIFALRMGAWNSTSLLKLPHLGRGYTPAGWRRVNLAESFRYDDPRLLPMLNDKFGYARVDEAGNYVAAFRKLKGHEAKAREEHIA